MGLTADLPQVDPPVLRAAVKAALAAHSTELSAPSLGPRSLSGRFPSVDRLRAGAEAVGEDASEDVAAAVFFQSLLELGYLVASADGLADEEREALADLVAHATGSAVAHDTLTEHFRVLDATCEALGRRERLGRVAAQFEDFVAREEAMSFAALVAMADGKLEAPESEALLTLGQHFELSEGEVQAVVAHVVASIRRAVPG